MESDKPKRSDAKANREKIIAIARDAFESDPQVSLNLIAKLAGVGPGTLYRHFPNRESLVIGVYRHEIDALVVLAPTLVRQLPPLEAFRQWCDRLERYGRVKHGLTDVLHSPAAEPVHKEVYGSMVNAVGQLLAACQSAGVFRPDLDAEDVLLLLAFLWRFKDPEHDPGRGQRMLELVIEGLSVR